MRMPGADNGNRLGNSHPKLRWHKGRATALRRSKHVLITGGAGFIGTNLAARWLSEGTPVVLVDNLSRPGVEDNWAWLSREFGSAVELREQDITKPGALRHAVRNASAVFHLAAQVAVTTSLVDPVLDFNVNARGTLNVLEALRALPSPPPLLFTSTNKVYGDLGHVKLRRSKHRYEPVDRDIRAHGFDEDCPLQFHSPYGCSKGAAAQYVLEYSRSFKIPAVVFHMSCIYGPHQCGNEDQGWVAHFLIQALKGNPITIYGDGNQVRDILFVEDLINAFLLAHDNIERLSGQAFNIGGGPQNTVSLAELLEIIADLQGHPLDIQFEDWRAADQFYYVSDTRRFSAATGWHAATGIHTGVKTLQEWLQSSQRIQQRRLRTIPSLKDTRRQSEHSGVRVNGKRPAPDPALAEG